MTSATRRWPRGTWTIAVSRAAAVVSVAAVALSVVVAITGGFHLAFGNLSVSVRSLPGPAAVAAIAAALAWVSSPVLDGRRTVLDWLIDPSRSASTFVAVLACATTLTGLAGGLWTAGSADASGYVSEAHMLASGRLAIVEPLAYQLALPDAPRLVSPLGFRPAADADVTGRLVPTYPPGLPLLMAPLAVLAGDAGPFLVVPVAGGLAVWLMFAIGRALGHPGAGLAGSALLASFPAFLFQLLQPMSDVPVAAAWLFSTYLALTRRPVLSAFAAGLAVLVRPNLALTAVPLALCAATSRRDTSSESTFRTARRWLAAFVPALAALAMLHTVWYGAPWRSGYGSATDLFSLDNVGPNIQHYATWLLETGGLLCIPLIWALIRPPAEPRGGRLGTTAIALAAIVIVAAYLPYYVFDQWHYLRFLLPAIGLLLALGAAAVAVSFTRRLPPALGVVLATLAVVAQAAWQLDVASDHDVFRLALVERRYALTADWLRTRTPETAVIVCAQQSGSVALNASRSVLRWDLAPRDSLDQVVAAIEATGRTAWILVEGWEQPAFTAQHGHTQLGALDWPPAAEVKSAVQVRVHRAADRAAFRAGTRVATEYVTQRQF